MLPANAYEKLPIIFITSPSATSIILYPDDTVAAVAGIVSEKLPLLLLFTLIVTVPYWFELEVLYPPIDAIISVLPDFVTRIDLFTLPA